MPVSSSCDVCKNIFFVDNLSGEEEGEEQNTRGKVFVVTNTRCSS